MGEVSDAQRIAEKVKQLREMNSLTLQQVADRSGFSKSHIWEFEQGTSRNPTLSMLRGMADCFGVSLAYLVSEDVEAPRLHPVALRLATMVDEALKDARSEGFNEGIKNG